MLLSSLDDDDDEEEVVVVVVVVSRRKSFISSSLALARNTFKRSVCLSKLPNAKMCSSERRHRETERDRERDFQREKGVMC